MLFPGIAKSAILRYEEFWRSSPRFTIEIPEVYKSVLSRINGAAVFGMNLFGVPLTMLNEPPLLDRSLRQPCPIPHKFSVPWWSSVLPKTSW